MSRNPIRDAVRLELSWTHYPMASSRLTLQLDGCILLREIDSNEYLPSFILSFNPKEKYTCQR